MRSFMLLVHVAASVLLFHASVLLFQSTASADDGIGAKLTPIFSGEDLDGWQHSGNWEVIDGVITRTGGGGSLVYTAAKVPDDFELTFEWKVAAGSNSGVYYRPGQMEYQVLDNDKHVDGKNPRTSAASLYFCMPPSADLTKPVGQWNQGRVVCKGSVIQHWINGTKVVDFDYTDPQWADQVDMLRKRGGQPDGRGANLSLQDHNDPVWYRDIQMRSIPESESIDHATLTPAEVSQPALEAEKKKLQGILSRQKKAKN